MAGRAKTHVFLTTQGTSLREGSAVNTFRRLTHKIGLCGSRTQRNPRRMDFRHRFALKTLVRSIVRERIRNVRFRIFNPSRTCLDKRDLLVYRAAPRSDATSHGAFGATLEANAMKSTVSFQALLQRFFTDRLMQQRQASAHTISPYRDTFRLLLRFAHKRLHKTPDRLAFEDIDAPLVAGISNDLEKTRDIGARTRNLRLTAIRSFFRYAAFEAPAYSAQIQRVLSMHGKRHNRTLNGFMTRPEVARYLPPRTRHLVWSS